MNTKFKIALLVGIPTVLLLVGMAVHAKNRISRRSYIDTDSIFSDRFKKTPHDVDDLKRAINSIYGLTGIEHDDRRENINNQTPGENMKKISEENEAAVTTCRILTENGYSEIESTSRIISYDEFSDPDFSEYEKLDWTYYCIDAIMVDEKNEVVENVHKFIHDQFYNGVLEPQFVLYLSECQKDHDTDGKMTVYVRTDVIETDIEISVRPWSYYSRSLC